MTKQILRLGTFALAAFVLASAAVSAQTQTQTQTTQKPAPPAPTSAQSKPQQPPPPPATKPAAPTSAQAKQQPQPPPPPPLDYVIGTDDVLSVFVWREKEVSGDFVVRPDGMVSLPLLNDLKAAGLTPEEFRKVVEEAAKKMFTDPTVTIVVKEIKSRRVYITGQVTRPGPYLLLGPMTVVQLISTAGGLLEWADMKNILVISATLKDKSGQPMSFRINYDDLMKGKNLAKNNIELRPGDQVIVR